MGKGLGKRTDLTKGQKFDQLVKKVGQLEMKVQVTQMIMQQIGTAIDNVSKDLKENTGAINDLRYRLVGMQKVAGMNADELQKAVEVLKLEDFNTTSAKDDLDNGYTETDVVGENSVVILTSSTPDEATDQGIFRSKVKVDEMGQPALQVALQGKRVGDQVSCVLNEVKHDITILGIRSVPVVAAAAEQPQETLPVLALQDQPADSPAVH